MSQRFPLATARQVVRQIGMGLFTCLSFSTTIVDADETIDMIEFYGIGKLDTGPLLAASGLKLGDRMPNSTQDIIKRLEAVPGVKRAAVGVVRVVLQREQQGTAGVVYIGIDDGTRPPPEFKSSPSSDIVLPESIVKAYQELMDISGKSLGKGELTEDISRGYSLMVDRSGGATQEKLDRIQNALIQFANDSSETLIEVLDQAKDAEQRIAAAWIIGIRHDQPSINALCSASRDANFHVRNNAIRAIGVKMHDSQLHPERAIDIPTINFVEMLNALDWTDRNKAMMVLLGLKDHRSQNMLDEIRQTALPSLVEMCRWKYEGHSLMAFMLLGRAANISDAEMKDAWENGKKEEFIARVFQSTAKTN